MQRFIRPLVRLNLNQKSNSCWLLAPVKGAYLFSMLKSEVDDKRIFLLHNGKLDINRSSLFY
jgi:hypothetical protein